jgi:hypothetical protein
MFANRGEMTVRVRRYCVAAPRARIVLGPCQVIKLAKVIKKTAAMSGMCDGFIGKRMVKQYVCRAGYLFDEGALPERVDEAIEKFGFAMRPFRMSDLARQRHQLGDPQAPWADKPQIVHSKTADLLWERGRFDHKTGAGWYEYKLFRTVGARHWVFGTETDKVLSTGKRELLTLYDIVGTPIRRHHKIKGAANPFDPQWERYFEERLGFATMDSLRGRMRLIRLWLDQQRSCPDCHRMVTKSSGWRLYHMERKIDGGKDTIRNLTLPRRYK